MSLVNRNWEHNYLYTNGVRLHYISEGEGNLMLMLHGFPEFWYSWRHQITAFSNYYRVVAPDLRGYNYSDKLQSIQLYSISELVQDIAGIITNLGYEKCILVGHDWGGLIAWYFADQYPKMVEKLIVLNIPHPAKLREGLRTPQQLRKSWYVFFFQLPFLPELLLRWNNYKAIESAFINTAINKSAFTDEDIQAYKKSAAKPEALTAMINYYRCFVRQTLRSEKSWNKLDVPTLMIWAENDTALGKELTYRTEDYVNNLTLKYIPNCSHWVQQEQPELVNQYIADFLQISF